MGKRPPDPQQKRLRFPWGTSGLSLAEHQSALGVIEICGERTDVRPDAEGKDIVPQSQRDTWLVVGKNHKALHPLVRGLGL